MVQMACFQKCKEEEARESIFEKQEIQGRVQFSDLITNETNKEKFEDCWAKLIKGTT